MPRSWYIFGYVFALSLLLLIGVTWATYPHPMSFILSGYFGLLFIFVVHTLNEAGWWR